MNVNSLFESLEDKPTITKEQNDIINKLMSLTTPLDFGDEFDDDILNELEDSLDALETERPNILYLSNVISSLPTAKSSKPSFI